MGPTTRSTTQFKPHSPKSTHTTNRTAQNDPTPSHAPDTNFCERCPLNREVQLHIDAHERRILALEADVKLVRDFMIESKTIRYMTMGGGMLSIVTLVLTIANLINP